MFRDFCFRLLRVARDFSKAAHGKQPAAVQFDIRTTSIVLKKGLFPCVKPRIGYDPDTPDFPQRHCKLPCTTFPRPPQLITLHPTEPSERVKPCVHEPHDAVATLRIKILHQPPPVLRMRKRRPSLSFGPRSLPSSGKHQVPHRFPCIRTIGPNRRTHSQVLDQIDSGLASEPGIPVLWLPPDLDVIIESFRRILEPAQPGLRPFGECFEELGGEVVPNTSCTEHRAAKEEIRRCNECYALQRTEAIGDCRLRCDYGLRPVVDLEIWRG